ncbi:MAG: hypothetical protein RL060_622 [Bacteroidota bacterium]|jgi:hypothetical protein
MPLKTQKHTFNKWKNKASKTNTATTLLHFKKRIIN